MVGHRIATSYPNNAVGIAIRGRTCGNRWILLRRYGNTYGIDWFFYVFVTHHRGIPKGIAVIVGYLW